jgi:DNA-binding transcriptional ArsR family regulator
VTAPLDDYGDVFAALADPNRRAVLAAIAAAGEGTATTIAAGLPISRQAVVKHLVQLDRARLVQARRAGREVRYRVRPGRLSAAGRELEAIAAIWDDTLSTLKRIAEAAARDDATRSAPNARF